MTTYQIEYSRSSRAGCKGTCKSNIESGALRLGSISSGAGFDRTYWKHFPGCCTDRVLSNVLAAVGDPTRIPGYSELEPHDQALVKSTFVSHETKEAAKDGGEEGHPAKKARKTPTKKELKAKKDKEATEALLDKEEEEEDEGSEEAEEAPKKKKAATTKKSAKSPKAKTTNGKTKKKASPKPKGKKKAAKSDE